MPKFMNLARQGFQLKSKSLYRFTMMGLLLGIMQPIYWLKNAF